MWGTAGLARTGVYLLTPCLLTAALVSAAGVLLVNRRLAYDLPEYFFLWVTALVLSAAATGMELVLSFKEVEEFQWN